MVRVCRTWFTGTSDLAKRSRVVRNPISRSVRSGRREITAEIVQSIEWLLVFGLKPAVIATRLGVTEYVVGLIREGSQWAKAGSVRLMSSRPQPHRSTRGCPTRSGESTP